MIKIAHLYYDLLNLYGESGNIAILENSLKKLNIEYSVDKLSIDDELKILDYDFIYIGSGTEENEWLVLEHLKKYTEEIKKYIEDGKVFLVTGDTLALFTNEIIDDGNNLLGKGLGVIDTNSKFLEKRIVCESLFSSEKFENDILGFQNRQVDIEEIKEEERLFNVKSGIGASNELKYEGIKKNNFFATFLIGPLLVRNAEILIYFIKLITKIDDVGDKLDLEFPINAYNKFKEIYYSNT